MLSSEDSTHFYKDKPVTSELFEVFQPMNVLIIIIVRELLPCTNQLILFVSTELEISFFKNFRFTLKA